MQAFVPGVGFRNVFTGGKLIRHHSGECARRPRTQCAGTLTMTNVGYLEALEKLKRDAQRGGGNVQGETKKQEQNQKSSRPQKKRATEILGIQARLLDRLSKGDSLSGIVSAITEASVWVDCGVFRRVTKGGEIVEKQVFGRLGRKKLKSKKIKEGRPVDVRVKRADVAAARLELEISDGREKGRKKGRLKVSLDDLVAGDSVLNGVVFKALEKGALVDVGAYRIGKKGKRVSVLAYLERKFLREGHALSSDKVIKDTVQSIYEEGDEITVHVRAVHLANGFLWVSEIPVDKEMIAAKARERAKKKRILRRRKDVTSLEPGTTRKGIVRAVEAYGAFVDVGVSREGLVYWREMRPYGREWQEHVHAGDEVVVEVLSTDEGRLGLALVAGQDAGDADDGAIENSRQSAEDHEKDPEETFSDKFDDEYFDSKYI